MRNRNLEHDWTLSSVGKPEAEPGSPEWAIYTRARIQELLGERESSIEHLSYAWDAMIKHEGWRHLYAQTKRPFNNFEHFCFEPKPWGLGYKREAIEGIIHERKSAQRHAQHPKEIGEPYRPTISYIANKELTDIKCDNVTLKNDKVNNISTGRGNDAEYLTARIARKRPDILERMKVGEYKSVRQAAIDAGIIRELTTVEKMQKLWLKMTPDEQAEFLTWTVKRK